MDWKVVTITPKKVGMQYTALVYKPGGYILDARSFDAIGDIDNRNLPYKNVGEGHPGSEESVDLWKLGLIYTGKKPRPVDVKALERDIVLGKDKPTVADGDGGGPGRSKVIKTKVLSVRISSRIVKT